jgi:hypothetical protein
VYSVLTSIGHLIASAWQLELSWRSASTFGIVAEFVTAIVIFVWSLLCIRNGWLGMSNLATSLRDYGKALLVTLVGIASVIVLTFFAAVPVAIYKDHESLRASVRALHEESMELEKRRHILFRSDPLFVDLSYMLQAFASFRNAARVPGGYDCAVYITAPKETFDLALMIGNLSVGPSGCSTLGPFDFNVDPIAEKDALGGMVANKIVFHQRADDVPANQLFNNLGNLIQCKRSYVLPSTPLGLLMNSKLFIWLQFGSDVRWSDQLR